MDTAQRMRLVRIIEKMDNNKDFSRRIGIKKCFYIQKTGQKKSRDMIKKREEDGYEVHGN